jgi:superfamily II DNA/RNA helicase
MTFQNLPLHPHILKALEKSGYESPTEIQAKAVPKAAKGFDIRACAQPGTGKTAAFLLPTLSRLSVPSKAQGKGPRALILVPTRELALQVASQAQKYSRFMKGIHTVCLVGGVPYPVQKRKLKHPCDILIATPGRLIDLMDQGLVNFSRLEVAILDEADRMLDMGFAEPVRRILESTPSSRQTLLFSATLDKAILDLSAKFMNKPMEIVTKAEKKSLDTITQNLYYSNDLGHKNRLLERILTDDTLGHTIIFTATKRHADQLTRELRSEGYQCAALHGDMTQGRRTRTIKQLRSGEVDILVATDVAARGIDVSTITHVINFDLPQNVEDYVHRIGRTGRAGRTGIAISFVGRGEGFFLKKIEKYTGQEIAIMEFEGLEPQKREPGKERSENAGPKKPFKKRFGERSNKPFKKSGKRFENKPGSAFKSKKDRQETEKQEGGKKPFKKSGSWSAKKPGKSAGPFKKPGAKKPFKQGKPGSLFKSKKRAFSK